MHTKIKNTLTGLVVAFAMLSVSYAVGNPPAAHDSRIVIGSNLLTLQADADQSVRQRNRAMNRQLSMPFFSFARLMPKQGG